MKKTLIVIPTYNESENIENIIRTVFSTIQEKNFSILIVDDNSQDGTREIIEELKTEFSNLLTLYRSEKKGLASAYIEGFKYGISLGFDYFIEMDADFSHNPKYLPTMFSLLQENDVVIGSRNIKNGGTIGWSLLRTIISKGGSLYSKMILNCPINDLTGGFNGWSLKALDKINLDTIISNGYSFQIEMKYKAYKKKCKIKEFPIIFEDRKYGCSKMSKKIFFEAMINVIKIKFMN